MQSMLLVLGLVNLGAVLYLLTRKTGVGLDGAMREEFARNRKEFSDANKDLRLELSGRLDQLRDKNDDKLEHIRKTVEFKLDSLQKDNAHKLERMRETVDEK